MKFALHTAGKTNAPSCNTVKDTVADCAQTTLPHGSILAHSIRTGTKVDVDKDNKTICLTQPVLIKSFKDEFGMAPSKITRQSIN